MATVDLVDFEMAIKQLPGVLGCVILTDDAGRASEIEAFASSGADKDLIHRLVTQEMEQRGLSDSVRKVMVIELEAQSLFGDRETLERAAELAEQEARSRGALAAAEELSALADDLAMAGSGRPGGASGIKRPPVRRVILTSSVNTYAAEVSLGVEGEEVVGQASGGKTPHGLTVLAEATLQAAAKVIGRKEFVLKGASLVNIVGQEAVLVLVAPEDGIDLIGCALVREGPLTEAAVRATLAAINRRFVSP